MTNKKFIADQFWKWFETNNSQFLFVREVDAAESDRLMALFRAELNKYNPNLFFEIGGDPKQLTTELIITADGIKDHFPDVEYLVEQAPVIKGWKIIAFKPAMGPGFSVELGGQKFDPETVLFLPLQNEDFPGAFGMAVFYPDFTEATKNLYYQGTFIMLDTLLGEKSACLDIDHIQIEKTPDNIEEYPTLSLSRLPQIIELHKAKNN